jgi:dihydrofolate synthase / folylpolyglutamate synthase
MTPWRVPYPKFGGDGGLRRVGALAERLGVELGAFGATGAVITGSNGKGSTAAMLASILRQAGGPVGLFTSPHLFALNERFAIDGEDIGDAELAHHWARVRAAADVYCAEMGEVFGGFEFLFLIAADWFAARGCAFTVWEAGIGGRYDPTRLVTPRRTALVSLDLEHTALLGDTLEAIAFDKLDAAPAGATVFCGESCAPLRDRIEAHCAMRGVSSVFPDARITDALPLAGRHQRNNAALAIALARDMAALNEDMIARGLAATRWPGRLEIINSDPLIVIDVGHTPAAIRAALDSFKSMQDARDGVLVCGASVDKSAAEMICALAPAFPVIVCTAACHKGRPAGEIAVVAAAANPDAEILIADDIVDARRIALAKARGGAAIYVAGGLFVAAEFRCAHLGLDPAALVFF